MTGDPDRTNSSREGVGTLPTDVAALSFFFLLALFLTGPSLFSPEPRVAAGETADTWLHMWAFWRAKYLIFSSDYGYLFSPLVTFPVPVIEPIAVFDPLMPLLSVPLQFMVEDMAGVFNLLVLGGLTFSGMAGYRLISFLVGRPSAGLVGGVVVAMNPFVYRQVVGGFSEYTWWGLVPLSLWLYLKYLSHPTRSVKVTYLVSLIVLFLFSIYCAAYFMITALFLLMLEAFRAWRGKSHRLARAVRLQGTALLCLSPLLAFWGYHLASMHFSGISWKKDFPAPSSAFRLDSPQPHDATRAYRTLQGSVDLAHALSLSNGSEIDRYRNSGDPNPFSRRFDLVFGEEWVLLLLLAAPVFFIRSRRREYAGWGLLAVFFFVLALGPYPVWRGTVTTGLLLPYGWLYKWLPGFSRLIVPGRAFLGTILCLSILAAGGADYLLGRFAGSRKSGGVLFAQDAAVALLAFLWFASFGYTHPTLPGTPAGIHPVYYRIAGQAGHFGLLELPLRGDIPYRMYSQSVHGQPIYGGFFLADEVVSDPIRRNALVLALNDEKAPLPPPGDIDSSLAFLAQQGFRYLLLHADGYAEPGGFGNACRKAESVLGPAWFKDAEVAAWPVPGGG